MDRPEIPVKLAGTIKGFDLPGENPENWQLPEGWTIPRGRLRSMPPHAVYAVGAMREAIEDSALTPESVSHPRTGMMCASAGSTRMLYRHVDKMLHAGILRCQCVDLTECVSRLRSKGLLAREQA